MIERFRIEVTVLPRSFGPEASGLEFENLEIWKFEN